LIDTSEEVEVEAATILEEPTEDMIIENPNNKSMMDVVPSHNYKKLLQDFSNIQNSSDI
jgi:hypothetical protein